MADDTTTAGDDTVPAGDQQSGTDDTTGPAGDTSQDELAQWRAEADKWKNLARKHEARARQNEDRAKQNADAASKAKTVEEQLNELREQLVQRDIADIERASREATAQIHLRLAEAGVSRNDAAGLLETVDPIRLLNDGQPDEKAIKKLADSLIRLSGRATPDPDQGRRGDDGPLNMNDILRRAAGRR